MRRRLEIPAIGVGGCLAGLLLGALLVFATTAPGGGSDLARVGGKQAILLPVGRGPASYPGQARARASAVSAFANIDPDARDPELRAAHLRLLATRPFLQRVPYRDRELGVTLVGARPDGRPVLLVSYLGSLDAARRDLQSAFAAAHDEGSEYELRYERLAR